MLNGYEDIVLLQEAPWISHDPYPAAHNHLLLQLREIYALFWLPWELHSMYNPTLRHTQIHAIKN